MVEFREKYIIGLAFRKFADDTGEELVDLSPHFLLTSNRELILKFLNMLIDAAPEIENKDWINKEVNAVLDLGKDFRSWYNLRETRYQCDLVFGTTNQVLYYIYDEEPFFNTLKSRGYPGLN